MKALALLMFFLGLMVLFRPGDDSRFDSARDETVAANFVTYRNAAWRYVYAHKSEVGEIAIEKFELINNYRPLRNWRTLVQDGVCYIYGDLTISEVNAVKKTMKNTMGLGFVSNGYMVNIQGGGRIPVPASIPNGYLVSVTNLD